MPADAPIVNTVRTYSTATPGRVLNEVRGHHFVIDEPQYNGGPGEDITPADAFLSGVLACGVLLVETFARQDGIALRNVDATIEGVRNPDNTSRFAYANLRFEITGATQAQAEDLVARYQAKCPLYHALSVATTVNVEAVGVGAPAGVA
jgi:uncharacterized OsmC-like protein